MIGFAGCASESSPSGPPIAIDDFATAYNNAFCDKDVRCGAYGDTSTCLSGVFAHPDDETNVVDVAIVAAGKATYDPNAAGNCIAAIEASPCDYANSNTDLERISKTP